MNLAKRIFSYTTITILTLIYIILTNALFAQLIITKTIKDFTLLIIFFLIWRYSVKYLIKIK